MDGFRNTPGRIEVDDAVQRTDAQGDAVLLDVREQDEWAAGHAPNAVLLPLSSLGGGAPLPNEAQQRPVVVICRSGHRSQEAAALLQQREIEAVDVVGGMMAWARAGHPIVDEQGDFGAIM